MFDFSDENKNYLNDIAQFDYDLLEPELVLRKNNQFNNLEINLDENLMYLICNCYHQLQNNHK